MRSKNDSEVIVVALEATYWNRLAEKAPVRQCVKYAVKTMFSHIHINILEMTTLNLQINKQVFMKSAVAKCVQKYESPLNCHVHMLCKRTD